MPVDPGAGHQPCRTGDGPYPCSTWPHKPGAGNTWALDYGYCRTSLDLHAPADRVGSADPRCPAGCPHKAPHAVAVIFSKQFAWRGAVAAAAMARQHREQS